ncbi:hypothetical protein AN957_19225 [Cytobacillus solani]|uniref:IrrE N-terminal-like domain-containing protein n=2 Tax=Cytobacillus solani TaxID=1637975 RepID=A0A0Q3QQR4_9BACI|nr:hypothetical protein AN957_19225 [Cytobacillus solani]
MTMVRMEIIEKAMNVFDSFKYFHEQYFLTYDALASLELLLDHNEIFLMPFNFELQKISGRLEIDELGTTIAVNSNHSQNRQTFTIAHELGHFYLHSHKRKTFTETKLSENLYSLGEVLIEREANLFASELLIPEEVLEKMLVKKFNYFRISNTIGVSTEALKWRIHRYVMFKYNTDYRLALMVTEDYRIKSMEMNHSRAFIFIMDKNKYLQREIFEEIMERESFFENLLHKREEVSLY